MSLHTWIVLRLLWIQLLILAAAEVESNRTDSNTTVKCEREREYDDLDVRKVMGKWKVMEVYLHNSKEGANEFSTCPQVTIWEAEDFPRTTFGPSTENQPFHQQAINAKFRQQYRHLRLLWDEAGYTTEYALYFRNDSAGYWHVLDKQNGTLASRENYQHFGGTVQVLKAVNDHLVLNFCQEGTPMRSAQLYSVLFSRNPGELYGWEIDAVHSMLQNKKLSTASRRMVCGNSADRAVHSILFSILTCALAFFIRSS